MFRRAKRETVYSTDFALRTDDFGLTTVYSTDFALRTDDFGLATVYSTDFALRTDDFGLLCFIVLNHPLRHLQVGAGVIFHAVHQSRIQVAEVFQRAAAIIVEGFSA